MTPFRLDRAETTEQVTPRAFQLIDSLTGRAPVGVVKTFLDARLPDLTWVPTGIAALVSGSGILLYPYLEKKQRVIGEPSRRYRFRVEAQHYEPDYSATADGIEFDAFPYNDEVVEENYAKQVDIVPLHPGPTYPFAPELPVLRGAVVRAAGGARVPSARVAKANEEKVLSDRRGEFALPLRRITAPQFDIDVDDLRTNEGRTKTIVVPDMLGINVVIDIL
jgi:hypothetical protein